MLRFMNVYGVKNKRRFVKHEFYSTRTHMYTISKQSKHNNNYDAALTSMGQVYR